MTTDVLKVESDKSIVKGSRVVWNPGNAPLRIVLRKDPDTEGGYVVHTEALKLDTDKGCFVHSSYYGGSYCYYGKDGMLKAVEKFTERAAEL